MNLVWSTLGNLSEQLVSEYKAGEYKAFWFCTTAAEHRVCCYLQLWHITHSLLQLLLSSSASASFAFFPLVFLMGGVWIRHSWTPDLLPPPPPAWRLVGKGHKCVRLEATDEVKIFFRWIVFGVYQVLGRISIPQYSLLLSQLTHWSQFVWSKIHTSQWKLFCLIHWHKANY